MLDDYMESYGNMAYYLSLNELEITEVSFWISVEIHTTGIRFM